MEIELRLAAATQHNENSCTPRAFCWTFFQDCPLSISAPVLNFKCLLSSGIYRALHMCDVMFACIKTGGEGIVHGWRSQRTMGTFSPSLSPTTFGNFLIVSYQFIHHLRRCVCTRSTASAMWSKMIIIVADSSLTRCARMCEQIYERNVHFFFLLRTLLSHFIQRA